MKKQEHTTHLIGAELVGKTHPRIELRGRIDSLRAAVIELQVKAKEAGKAELVNKLEEVLDKLVDLQYCEVRDTPCSELSLWGLSDGEIHERSHFPERYYGISHISPHHEMGFLASALNRLRTQVRETELCACRAFETSEGTSRTDIVQVLNRLSSAIYILTYDYLPDGYNRLAGFARKVSS